MTLFEPQGPRAAPKNPLGDDAAHILVVDDDTPIRTRLARYLAGAGYRVTTAASAEVARAKMQALAFDCVVLDVMMPGESGFDFARDLRGRSAVPILMLTARSDPQDRVAGLEIGAEDYLPKPFDPRELLLRLGNILKRAAAPPKPAEQAETVRFGPFSFSLERGVLAHGTTHVRITDRERDVLTSLARANGAPVPREALAAGASAATPADRSVDVQVNRLRRKIEQDAANPRWLMTVRGQGYRLAIEP